MKSASTTIQEYIDTLPEDRREPIKKLRQVFTKNLPKGFREEMSYGMIGYVIPHSLYPAGYHCDPSLPLPFLAMASQKNFIAVYHMGVYASPEILNWFETEFLKRTGKKADMGKSCIRFKKPETIPYDLLGELARKFTPQEWIALYEKNYKKKA